MLFLCVKTFYKKKYGNSLDTLIYNTTCHIFYCNLYENKPAYEFHHLE